MTLLDKTNSNQELPFSAAVFTSFLCVVFGANAVAIKISLSGLGPFTTAGLRFSIAAFTIFVWARVTGRSLRIKNGQARQLFIVSLLFTSQLGLLYFGLHKSNASRGTLLINLQPFFVLFLAHYFIAGDRIAKRKVLGLFMGFAGLVLLFIGKEKITSNMRFGDLMILLASFLWACSAVYVKRIIHAFDPFQIVLYSMIFSVPLFLTAGFLWDGTMVGHVGPKVLIALLYQSLLTASFGFVAWNTMLQKYGAVSLHSFIFIMPIAGVFLGGMVLGEPISPNILLALSLIVSGIVVINFKTRRDTPLYPPRGI